MPNPSPADLAPAERQRHGQAVGVHAVEQPPGAVLHADHRLAVLGEASSARRSSAGRNRSCARAWDGRRVQASYGAARHVRRRAPHAQEARRDLVVARRARTSASYTGTSSGMCCASSGRAGDAVGARVLALAQEPAPVRAARCARRTRCQRAPGQGSWTSLR